MPNYSVTPEEPTSAEQWDTVILPVFSTSHCEAMNEKRPSFSGVGGKCGSGECEKSEGVGKLTKKNKKPKHLGLGENKSEKKKEYSALKLW